MEMRLTKLRYEYSYSTLARSTLKDATLMLHYIMETITQSLLCRVEYGTSNIHMVLS